MIHTSEGSMSSLWPVGPSHPTHEKNNSTKKHTTVKTEVKLPKCYTTYEHKFREDQRNRHLWNLTQYNIPKIKATIM